MTLLVLFSSCMLRLLEKRIRLCSRASWLGVFGMDFSSVTPKEKSFLFVFAEGLMRMGTIFGNVLTSLLFKSVKS